MSNAITVVGSVNLDLVALGARLPRPGETLSGATFARYPGGKGANQALAARRLGATVRLVAAVGADPFADEALALLRAANVDLQCCVRDRSSPTGVALIVVGSDGENQIVVAPGANAALTPAQLPRNLGTAVLCQLEIPDDALLAIAARRPEFLCVNLAPARPVPHEVLAAASVLVVNETEAEFYGAQLDDLGAVIAMTRGVRSATLRQYRRDLAVASPPAVQVIDTTAAGDAFVAALAVALLELQSHEQALRFACAAGALTTTGRGAQPSLPTRVAVDALLKSRTA
ncbi:MAG TPA: ribokinase [Steroidobacteraceae bacterium]|nr:ribokinase [Steroidobacteraceae bacterium]HRX90838.1 ribokinase [Steroidobacteraceae bacterium]